MIPVDKTVKKFAYEDAEQIAKAASDEIGVDIKVKDIKFEVTSDVGDEDVDLLTDVLVLYEFEDLDDLKTIKHAKGYMIYAQKGGDIYIDKDVEEYTHRLVRSILKGYRTSKTTLASVKSSTAITAAEGDEDEDVGPDEGGFDVDPDFDMAEEDATVEDTLDSMADDIEDLQDSVDEVQEDDPSIEVDNNITDHYIVECDRCKGIFISAIIESDQQVRKVTGTCPLCGKETEQLIKWVIRDVDQERF